MKGQKTGGRKAGTPNKFRDRPSAMHVYEDLIGSFKDGSFYVYAHYFQGQCFYVGKGTYGRAWTGRRNEWWDAYVDGLASKGFSYDVRIVVANLPEHEAFIIEEALIKSRKPACNVVHNGTDRSQMSIAL